MQKSSLRSPCALREIRSVRSRRPSAAVVKKFFTTEFSSNSASAKGLEMCMLTVEIKVAKN